MFHPFTKKNLKTFCDKAADKYKEMLLTATHANPAFVADVRRKNLVTRSLGKIR